MAKATHALLDVQTDEVSMVDRGAVGRKFAFRKRDEAAMEDIIKGCLTTPLEDEAVLDSRLEKRGVDKKGALAIKGALRLIAAFKDSLRDQDCKFLADLIGAQDADDDDETGETKSRKAAQVDKAAAPEAAAETTAPTAAADIAKAEGDVMESLSPEIAARFASIQKAHEQTQERAAQLEKALHEQQDAQRTREFIDKAAREFPHLGPAKQLGPLLKSLADKDLYTQMERLLRGANERAQRGETALFSERGSPESFAKADEEDSAFSRLERAAASIAKAENIPHHKAITKACERDPKLYQDYCDSKPRPVVAPRMRG